MKNIFKVFGVIALAAIIGFSFVACGDGDGGGGGDKIDTTDLEAAIFNASIARDGDGESYGVMIATEASEVPVGRQWVTQEVWNTFDSVYKAAAETKANPSSQAAVNQAKKNLEAAITVFNAAKKDGSGSAITLSGTITVKNNGKIVPYVVIQAHDKDWDWQEGIKVHVTQDSTPWKIITKPFSESTTVYFNVIGFEDDEYKKTVFSLIVPDFTKDVYNSDVSNIAINLDLKIITISGTLSLDYGKTIPSAQLYIRKDGSELGSVQIFNVKQNTPAPWSINIDSFSSETAVYFAVVGFEGPIPWEYDQLFGLWDKDFGVKVHNSNKSGVALNLIKISGTVNVSYNGQPVPRVGITIHKPNGDDYGDWIANTELKSPAANTPWSIVIPAYTSDTGISIDIEGYTGDNNDSWVGSTTVKKTVKNTNVSGIAINLDLPED